MVPCSHILYTLASFQAQLGKRRTLYRGFISPTVAPWASTSRLWAPWKLCSWHFLCHFRFGFGHHSSSCSSCRGASTVALAPLLEKPPPGGPRPRCASVRPCLCGLAALAASRPCSGQSGQALLALRDSRAPCEALPSPDSLSPIPPVARKQTDDPTTKSHRKCLRKHPPPQRSSSLQHALCCSPAPSGPPWTPGA